jgi:hypothetical protein
LVNLSTLAIPAIAILALGGVISFLLAYSFYPEKHENVNIDGKCYELVGEAHKRFVNLAAREDIETLKLQISKVGPNDVNLPIIFSGRDSDIDTFKHKYNMVVTSQQRVKYYPNIDASIVTAMIPKIELQGIVGNLNLSDVYPSSKTVAGSVGIQPNSYLTLEDGKDVSIKLNEFMTNGIREIIANSDGVKSAECRNNMYVGQ